MIIEEVTYEVYNKIIKNAYQCYNDASFNEVNSEKCDEVHCLLFKDSKYRLGIIGGQINGQFLSPYSAPFGGFAYVSNEISINYIENAIDLLVDWCEDKEIKKIIIGLPPPIYEKNFIANQINVLYRHGFSIDSVDLNYQLELIKLNESYLKSLPYAGRKALSRGLRSDLGFIKCDTDTEKQNAFNIIQINRSKKGYPLRMRFEDILKTNIKKDYFLVTLENVELIASAIVYHVSNNIVQVVYWGDISNQNNLRPMNFLSYKVFEYYKEMGKEIVDIGPSTENSIPNYGLCKFKENIGCSICTKLRLIKQL